MNAKRRGYGGDSRLQGATTPAGAARHAPRARPARQAPQEIHVNHTHDRFPVPHSSGALRLMALAACIALSSVAFSARAQSVGENAAQGLAQAEGASGAAEGSDDGSIPDSDEEVPGPPTTDGDSDVEVAGPPKALGPVIPPGVGFNQKGGQLSAMALESAALGNPEVHYHVMAPGATQTPGYVNAPIVNPQTTQPNWHYHVVSALGKGSMNTSTDSHWHFYNSSGGAGQVPGPAPEYAGGIGAYGGAASHAWGTWAFGGMGAGNGMFAAYD
jgi:hypothetical protein